VAIIVTIASIGYDVYEAASDPSWENMGWLALGLLDPSPVPWGASRNAVKRGLKELGEQAGERGLKRVGQQPGRAAASNIAENAARGTRFESAVLKALGAEPNRASVRGLTRTGELRRSVPDLITDASILEIKDTKRVWFTRQLQVQYDAALASGRRLDLVVSPRTTHVVGGLKLAVERTGGSIRVFDPSTGSFTPWHG